MLSPFRSAVHASSSVTFLFTSHLYTNTIVDMQYNIRFPSCSERTETVLRSLEHLSSDVIMRFPKTPQTSTSGTCPLSTSRLLFGSLSNNTSMTSSLVLCARWSSRAGHRCPKHGDVRSRPEIFNSTRARIVWQLSWKIGAPRIDEALLGTYDLLLVEQCSTLSFENVVLGLVGCTPAEGYKSPWVLVRWFKTFHQR